VSRAKFDALIELLNRRGDIINDLQQRIASEMHRHGRDLHIQFTGIAQLQQEIDRLTRDRE
jgi:hypothetical protein